MKVVKLTYGTHGKSNEYVYLTNGNVRNGQIVQPSVTHAISGKVFGTTGVVQHTYKATSQQGQQAMAQAKTPLKKVYTGAEIGISSRVRTQAGTFANISGLGKTTNASGKWAVPDNVHFIRTNYIKEVRKFNVDAQDTNQGEE